MNNQSFWGPTNSPTNEDSLWDFIFGKTYADREFYNPEQSIRQFQLPQYSSFTFMKSYFDQCLEACSTENEILFIIDSARRDIADLCSTYLRDRESRFYYRDLMRFGAYIDRLEEDY